MPFEVVFTSADTDYVVVADVSEETGLVISVFGHTAIQWEDDHDCSEEDFGCRHNHCSFLGGRDCEDHCFRVNDDGFFFSDKSLEEVRQMVLTEMEGRK